MLVYVVGKRVVQFDELGYRRVESQAAHVVGNPVYCLMHVALQRKRCWGITYMKLARVFIDQVAPHSLQEALHSNDVARIPRARCIQWAGAHLV